MKRRKGERRGNKAEARFGSSPYKEAPNSPEGGGLSRNNRALKNKIRVQILRIKKKDTSAIREEEQCGQATAICEEEERWRREGAPKKNDS